MPSSSLSFRISRHTQDLAETVHALSQRLVTLEQRLEALEVQLQALRRQPLQEAEAESASLAPIEANIERLLQDCRQLLADQPSGFGALSPLENAEAEEGDVAQPPQNGVEAGDQVPSVAEIAGDAAEDLGLDQDDPAAVYAA
jgi:hypothetical protein